MTIQIGDTVTWQKREAGKLFLGIARCKVKEFGRAKDGTEWAVLTHDARPGDKFIAPLVDLHKD